LDEILLADKIIEIDAGTISFFGNPIDYLTRLFKHQYIENYFNEN